METKFLTATTKPEHFKKIFSMIHLIENTPYNMKEFIVFWIKSYNAQSFRVWIETDEQEKEVYSFMISQIVRPMIDDEIFIVLTYIDPNSDVGHNLLGCCEGWARTQGIKKISAYIYRNADGFCKKYNFMKGHVEIYKELTY